MRSGIGETTKGPSFMMPGGVNTKGKIKKVVLGVYKPAKNTQRKKAGLLRRERKMIWGGKRFSGVCVTFTR